MNIIQFYALVLLALVLVFGLSGIAFLFGNNERVAKFLLILAGVCVFGIMTLFFIDVFRIAINHTNF